MAFYSKRHYRQFQDQKDTPDRIRDRVLTREAGRLAVADREQKYPTLTADNAKEAMAYQEERWALRKVQLAESTKDIPLDNLLRNDYIPGR